MQKSKLDERLFELLLPRMIDEGFTKSEIIYQVCSGVLHRSTKQKWKAKIEAMLSSLNWQEEQEIENKGEHNENS